MSAVRAQSQTSLDEEIVENAALEALLEERETAKLAAGDARRAYAERDEAAKSELRQLDVEFGVPVRVGRFVVTRSETAGRSVAFETEPSERFSIRAGEQ